MDDELIYTLLLFENDGENPIRTISEISDTFYMVEDLNYGRLLYWQVIADDGQSSTYSATQSFKTDPVPDYRYHYVKSVNGKLKIIAADPGQAEICLSSLSDNSWRPRLSPNRDVIGFISNEGIDNHIFTMDRNGGDIKKITTTPIDGYDNAALDFSWSPDGSLLAYMNNNKLYSIEKRWDQFERNCNGNQLDGLLRNVIGLIKETDY